MTGRVQTVLAFQATAFDIKRGVGQLVDAGKLPSDAQATGWTWNPIRGATFVAIDSEKLAGCCPWTPGNEPVMIPLPIMPQGWWLEANASGLRAVVERAVGDAMERQRAVPPPRLHIVGNGEH